MVRELGGVSLFWLEGVDPAVDGERSSWRAFVPVGARWRGGLWIETDRGSLAADRFLMPATVLDEWKRHPSHNVMPGIEAAHLGPIPVTAFRRAFFTWLGDERMWPVGLAPFSGDELDVITGPWRRHLDASQAKPDR